MDGEPSYVLERRPRTLGDFVPTAWWQATSPESPFRKGAACSMATVDGRVTVAGNQRIVTAGGRRTETTLDSDGAILAAHRELFGFDLTRVPRLPDP